jgi:hypothetical protein
MGGFLNLFPDPPTPPSPILTAGAQTASNIGTAVTGSYLNNYNQVTPQGNLTYATDSTYDYVDPLTGHTHKIPRWTATQTPANEMQRQTNWNNDWSRANVARAGDVASQRLPGYFADDFIGRLDNAPRAPGVEWLSDTSLNPQQYFDDVGGPQRDLAGWERSQQTFGDAGEIRRGYGPADDFSSDRKRVEESLFQRMNPQLQQDDERLRQQLADQGLQPGTEAYDRAYDASRRQTTDARLAVTAAGGAEQQRMMDMAAQEAGFENAAQKQAYEQQLDRGTFANTARMEDFQKLLQEGNFENQAQKDAFTQAVTGAQFTNAAKAQQLAKNAGVFSAATTQRDKWLQEEYAKRAQPISEISALQSGAQLQVPNFAAGGSSQIANTDIAGIVNANFGQQLDIYKQNSANVNNVIGGLFGLAGSGAKAAATAYASKSDRRVKKNIHRIGTVFAAKRHDEPKKLPIYSFEYKKGHEDGGATRHIGPMAQDVEKIDPKAVTTKRGVKHIYPRKVMGDILRVA